MPRFGIPGRPPRRRQRLVLAAGPRPQPPLPPLPWRRIARIAAAASAVGVIVSGGWWLWSGGTLRVNTVIVVGAEIVDPNAIVAAAGVNGQSILTLDAGEVADRIERVPGVRAAAVQRDLPRGIVIEVQEAQGWGFWQAAGIRSVIDVEGHVLEKARPPAENAPTIYESSGTPLQPGGAADRDTVTLVTRLLSDGTFQRLKVTPLRFEFERSRGLTVRLADGPSAVFGDSHDYEFKVAAWAALLHRINTEQIAAGEIDLRFGRELVVR